RLQRIASVAAHVGIELIEPRGGACLAVAGKQYGFLRALVAGEQTRQFKTGVTGCSNNRGLDCGRHQARMSSIRVCRFRWVLLSGLIMSRVPPPGTVHTTSPQLPAPTARAGGGALPEMVLMPRKFCARRTSRTNSRTTRETTGMGSATASLLGRV